MEAQQTLIAKEISVRPGPRPTPLNTRTLWAAIALAAVLWSAAQADVFGRTLINPGGWSLLWQFIQASVQPDLSPDFLRLALHASLVTLAYAVCGTSLSLLLGLIGGLLSSEAWWQAVLRSPAYKAPWLGLRAALAAPRSIHEIIWGLFFIHVLGLDPLAAVLAIALPFGAIAAKVFAEILDEAPRASFKAILNSGAPPLAAFVYGLLPQALPNLLSYAFYRFECSLRSAAVLGAIGAGGLGYEILLSSQSLRYEQMWTFLYALIILSGLADYWSSAIRQRLSRDVPVERLLERLLERLPERLPERLRPRDHLPLALNDAPQCAPRSPWPDSVAAVSLAALLISTPLAFWYVGADFTQLAAPRTVHLLAQAVRQFLPPALEPALLHQLFTLTLQTLALSILAMTMAGLGGAALSFLAARNFTAPAGARGSRRALGNGLLLFTRSLLLILRAIPASIWALIMLFVIFPGILPGALALGLYTLGVLGRLMAETVESLDDRPTRALTALGASGPQAFIYSALPRALPGFISYTLYRWEVCARETVIVGVVGAGGLGRLLAEQLSNFDYAAVAATLICFIALTMLVDVISALARRARR